MMRIGLVIRNSGPEAITTVRTAPPIAEDLGFDAVWLTDHVIGARHYAPVYGPEWAEALSCLSYMAATTSRLRLGVGVLVLPYRDPVLTAKMLSTIDNLSDGRLVVGVGTGWSKVEYQALGRWDFYEPRGAVADESLDLMVQLWEGGESDWNGEHFQIRNVTFEPAPAQRPHPPIWVGGQSPPALRRAARIGDAWHPTNIPASEVATLGERIDDLAGRSVPRTIRVAIAADEVDGVRDRLAEYEEAGCVEAAVGFREHEHDVNLQLARRLAARLDLA